MPTTPSPACMSGRAASPIYGGIIGAVLGVLIISKIKKISPLNYLDIGALAF